jgi:hypothetical protein
MQTNTQPSKKKKSKAQKRYQNCLRMPQNVISRIKQASKGNNTHTQTNKQTLVHYLSTTNSPPPPMGTSPERLTARPVAASNWYRYSCMKPERSEPHRKQKSPACRLTPGGAHEGSKQCSNSCRLIHTSLFSSTIIERLPAEPYINGHHQPIKRSDQSKSYRKILCTN